MENTKPILIDVRTKLPLDCYVKLSAYTAEKKMKRGKLIECALNEYWDWEIYLLDKAEMADLCKHIPPVGEPDWNAERREQLAKRIAKFEQKHGIVYDVEDVF